jgi:hypothetical protein
VLEHLSDCGAREKNFVVTFTFERKLSSSCPATRDRDRQASLNTKHKPTLSHIMQPNIMASLGGLFVLAYLACVIAVVIFVLSMLCRFVCAHERLAGALDIISRKLRDDAKP